jgi:hypothetical protein
MSLTNALAVLEKAVDVRGNEEDILGHFIFLYCDLVSFRTFDPITHLNMFDIGIPPSVFKRIAVIWNASQTLYLVSYVLTPNLISEYGFEDVTLVGKIDSLGMRGTILHFSSYLLVA